MKFTGLKQDKLGSMYETRIAGVLRQLPPSRNVKTQSDKLGMNSETSLILRMNFTSDTKMFLQLDKSINLSQVILLSR